MRNLILLILALMTFSLKAQTYTASITVTNLGITNGAAVLVIGTPKRVSDYPSRTTPSDTDLILLADPVAKTNWNVTYFNLRQAWVPGPEVPVTLAWLGPTNFITLGYNQGQARHYYYTAFTPCYVNGFTFGNSTTLNPATLTISNAASTNITFTILSKFPQEDTSSTYTITNGYVLKSWMEVADGMTNAVTRVFKSP